VDLESCSFQVPEHHILLGSTALLPALDVDVVAMTRRLHLFTSHVVVRGERLQEDLRQVVIQFHDVTLLLGDEVDEIITNLVADDDDTPVEGLCDTACVLGVARSCILVWRLGPYLR